MHYLVASLVLAAALLAGGCGQMGPLYEPEDSAAASAPPDGAA
jgi:predicted small lipoprotein YifL